jgi:hypothetical protein
MRHPNQATLALHAGGDLGAASCWMTARHVSKCEKCREELMAFQDLRDALPELADIPEISWDKLAAEMKANIRLGLEAGECVRQVETRLYGPLPGNSLLSGPRAVVAFAAVIVLALASVVLEHSISAVPDEGIVSQSTGQGIQVDQRGQGMSLMNRGAENVTFALSAEGSAGARYTDPETHIMTVNSIDGQ